MLGTCPYILPYPPPSRLATRSPQYNYPAPRRKYFTQIQHQKRSLPRLRKGIFLDHPTKTHHNSLDLPKTATTIPLPRLVPYPPHRPAVAIFFYSKHTEQIITTIHHILPPPEKTKAHKESIPCNIPPTNDKQII